MIGHPRQAKYPGINQLRYGLKARFFKIRMQHPSSGLRYIITKSVAGNILRNAV